MRHRCRNPKHPFYHRYGERGIDCPDHWFDSFAAFLNDMGKRPSLDYSLDRIDGTKGYSKENCRWATRREQNLNRTHSKQKPRRNPPITYRGITLSIKGWADRIGISSSALRHRIYDYDWPLEEALGFKARPNTRPQMRKHDIEWNGVTRHYSEWAAIAGILPDTFNARYFRLGWSMERTMSTPTGKQGSWTQKR